MARRARGLGLDVIAYDPYASEDKAKALVRASDQDLSLRFWQSTALAGRCRECNEHDWQFLATHCRGQLLPLHAG